MEQVKHFQVCQVADELRIIDGSNLAFAVVRQTSEGKYRLYSANTGRIMFTHIFEDAVAALGFFEAHYGSMLPWLLVL